MNIQNLKNARKAAHFTQSQAAKAIGVGEGTYKNYEQGNREPKGDTIVQLADLFHVTTDYLLGRDTGEPEPIDELEMQFNMSALEKKILDNYLSLPQSMRGDLMEFLQKAVKEVQEECGD